MSSPLSRSPSRAAPAAAAIENAAAAWVARRDAGLDARAQHDYEIWLDDHPAHRAAIARLDSAWSALDLPLRTGTADLVLGELRARGRHRRHRRLATGAAACLVAVGLTAFGLQRAARKEAASARPIVAAVVLPSIRSLPDGSVAELRDGAEIAVDFSGAERRVTLRRGEAHFQVKPNPGRPFIVTAGAVEVRAVGTAFCVQLGERAVEVLVTSGRVAVDSAAPGNSAQLHAKPAALITLAYVDAGQGVVVDLPARSSALPTVAALAPPQVQDRLAWRSPRLEFSGTPLIEAISLLNAHNRLQFVIDDPVLATKRVSGIFGAQNTQAFARAIEKTFDVKAERRGENEIVLRPVAK